MPSNEQNPLYEVAQQIAPGWERQRDFIESNMAPVREWMLREVAPQPGHTILELACGAGDLGYGALDRAGGRARLISTDLSDAMLDVARRRGAQLAVENVEYRTMDAQQIDLDADSVDRVLCRYGLMLMPDPAAALVGTRRVLRGGGRLVLAVWGPAPRNPFLALVGMAMAKRGHVPPPQPGEPGVFALADADRLRSLLRSAGFTDVRVDAVEVSAELPSIEEHLAIVADTAGPLGLALRALPDSERDAMAQQLEPAYAQFASGEGYALPGLALCAVAS
jgi:ubiquinone/menaquinone biosynthesis C-methylase UbiE